MPRRYPIVTLCGSTKLKDAFLEAANKFTLAGFIVLTCNLFAHADNLEITEEQKELLDDIHKRKILHSDLIVFLIKDKYMGESTTSEYEFAKFHDKQRYFIHIGEDNIAEVASNMYKLWASCQD